MQRLLNFVLSSFLACLLPITARALSDGDVILFPYFKDPGTQGVFLMASSDGLHFEHVNHGNPIFNVPAGLTRDPSIVRGPDELFHMTWTAGPKRIGYASSPDLVSWSAPRTIPVWGASDPILNSWAPELYYDEVEHEYLIVWASTDRGRFPSGSSEPAPDGGRFEHRLYVTTTVDFQTFSDTHLFFDPGFNVIDGMIARDVDANRFVMAFKDERVLPFPEKNIRIAFADSAQGTYYDVSESITGGGLQFLEWAEGPSLLRTDDGWRLYFDTYVDWSVVYNAYETTDLETWVDVSDQLIFPVIEGRLQHGTVFRAPRRSVGWLVPEPGTSALLGGGLAALGARRARSRVAQRGSHTKMGMSRVVRSRYSA
jgi:hypothetical protein